MLAAAANDLKPTERRARRRAPSLLAGDGETEILLEIDAERPELHELPVSFSPCLPTTLWTAAGCSAAMLIVMATS